jgi:putative transposase
MTPRKRLHHEAPFWVPADADYFVTICADSRGKNHFCHRQIGAAILASVRNYNDRNQWFCDLAVLMPDHIHLLVSFPPEKIISDVIGLWKRGLSRVHGISWQRNFFEHRMRNDENIQQKSDYVLNNPVRARLVDDPLKCLICGCRTVN